jgi:tetratricopeptide (TPR) repeat protein
LNERVVGMEGESLLDLPLQALALACLSPRERARHRQALSLLESGGGVHALALHGIPVTGLGVYEALLARSWAVRFDSPQEMIALAEAAVEVAEGLDPRSYGVKRVADLRARAMGELANAYRVADRLHLAERAFGQAYALLEEGTDDPHLRARLFDLEASFLGTRREFALALPRFRSLAELYRDLGDSHLSGRALVALALYTHYNGDSEEAIRINEEGMRQLDRRREPALFMQAIHNHLLFLVDLGRYNLAKKAIFENRRNLVIYRDRITALRLRGLEGRIYYGLGELASAETAFGDAREGLVKEGMSFYAALVSLELAMVFLRQGRTEEAEAEVTAAREIFLANEIYREYLGSVIYLEECLRRREATAELIEATIKAIRRKEIETPPRRG